MCERLADVPGSIHVLGYLCEAEENYRLVAAALRDQAGPRFRGVEVQRRIAQLSTGDDQVRLWRETRAAIRALRDGLDRLEVPKGSDREELRLILDARLLEADLVASPDDVTAQAHVQDGVSRAFSGAAHYLSDAEVARTRRPAATRPVSPTARPDELLASSLQGVRQAFVSNASSSRASPAAREAQDRPRVNDDAAEQRAATRFEQLASQEPATDQQEPAIVQETDTHAAIRLQVRLSLSKADEAAPLAGITAIDAGPDRLIFADGQGRLQVHRSPPPTGDDGSLVHQATIDRPIAAVAATPHLIGLVDQTGRAVVGDLPAPGLGLFTTGATSVDVVDGTVAFGMRDGTIRLVRRPAEVGSGRADPETFIVESMTVPMSDVEVMAVAAIPGGLVVGCGDGSFHRVNIVWPKVEEPSTYERATRQAERVTRMASDGSTVVALLGSSVHVLEAGSKQPRVIDAPGVGDLADIAVGTGLVVGVGPQSGLVVWTIEGQRRSEESSWAGSGPLIIDGGVAVVAVAAGGVRVWDLGREGPATGSWRGLNIAADGTLDVSVPAPPPVEDDADPGASPGT